MKILLRLLVIALVCLTIVLILVFKSKIHDAPWLTISEFIDDTIVPQDESIFFIETKPTRYRKLSTHQSCSIESAANVYADKQIFVLFTSNESVELAQTLMVKALRTYKNIHFKLLDVKASSKGTPFEAFIASDILLKSQYQVAHTADVLRLMILWKFGGSYFDTDVFVLKPTEETNYVCFQDDGSYLANGIINLVGSEGHELATKFIKNQMEHFDGNDWAMNGPSVITRVVQELCPQNDSHIASQCGHFNILPSKYCYAIKYPEWEKFFNPDAYNEVRERTNESYFVHIWNKMARSYKVPLDSHAPVLDFAKQSCPRIFSTRYDEF